MRGTSCMYISNKCSNFYFSFIYKCALFKQSYLSKFLSLVSMLNIKKKLFSLLIYICTCRNKNLSSASTKHTKYILRVARKRFILLGEVLALNTGPIGPVWVRTLILKSGLSPKSGLFKKTDFPPSLTCMQEKACKRVFF